MLTLNDIINVSFRKSRFSGYNTEDVDHFIDQVKEAYDELIKKNIGQTEEMEKQAAEKEQLLKKLDVLAGKIEDYRREEDEIKNALVSAQKLGDASIREARHKAEIIVKDATIKAGHIAASAEESIQEQKKELERLKQEVSDFRTQMLEIYKKHLTLIDAIPTHKPRQEPAPKAARQPEPPAIPEEPTVELPPDFHVTIANFDEEPDASPREPFPHGEDDPDLPADMFTPDK